MSSHPPSRCTVPCGGSLYIWEEYYYDNLVPVVTNELDQLLEDKAKSFDQVNAWMAEIEDLKEAASRGELQLGLPENYPAIAPIRVDPTMFELRWDFGNGMHLRQYHAEPDGYERLLLALHFHWKQIFQLRADLTRNAQDAEVQVAVKRLETWHNVEQKP